MKKNEKKALSEESVKSNIIVTNSARGVNDFALGDFKKSGITVATIAKYLEQDYLQPNEQGWKLFYPRLFCDQLTDYYTQRLESPSSSAKYIKPKGKASKLFRPLDLPVKVLSSKKDPIIITEGEKKAIKAVQEGFNCVSLAGVWAWKQNPENSEGEEVSDIISDIKDLEWKGKSVYLCYDSDMWEKEQVKTALYTFAAYLSGEKKSKVYIISLPKGGPKGLDDYLIEKGNAAFQKLIDKATALTLKDAQNILAGVETNIRTYPVEIFRKDLKNLLIELQGRLDAPLEYITSSFLAGAATLMEGKFSILVDPSKGWVDYPVLWTALVGNPSQKKTPCLSIIKREVDVFEKELRSDYQQQKQVYEEAYVDYKAELAKYKKEKENAVNDLVQPKLPYKPTNKIITTQSTTVEALAKALLKNEGRGVTIWVDELSSFYRGLGQYKAGGNDKEYFLQAWKKQPYTVTRSNEENNFTVEACHNIVGTIQPKVLDTTLMENGIQSDNGMIERWLYSLSSYEETGEKPINSGKLNCSLIRDIYSDINQEIEKKQFYFSTESQQEFDNFIKFIVKEKRSSHMSDLMKSYLQKQTDYVARFALILHVVYGQAGKEIAVGTVKDAIKLSRYFVSCFDHLIRQKFGETPLVTATLEYLRSRGIKEISPTKLYKSNTSRYKSAANAEIVLEILANNGYGRLSKAGSGKKFILYTS